MKKYYRAIWVIGIIAFIALTVLLVLNNKPLFGNAIEAQAEKAPVITAIMMIFIVAILAALFLILLMYVYTAIVLQTIAKRTKTKNPWLAWIPIANIYLMTQIAKVPGWTTFFVIASFIPHIGLYVVSVFTVALWWRIAEVRKRPGWWGLLMVIPIVNFVLMGILAWGKK